MTTWALCGRARLARISGRIRIIAAPVVPTRLAIAVPNARTAGIGPGRSLDVAGHQNSAGHGVERKQEHDEAEIFIEHGMDKGHQHGRAAGKPEDRQQRQRGPCSGDLAIMMMPESRKQQRSERDREQQAGEGQRKRPVHGRTVEPVRRLRLLRMAAPTWLLRAPAPDTRVALNRSTANEYRLRCLHRTIAGRGRHVHRQRREQTRFGSCASANKCSPAAIGITGSLAPCMTSNGALR